MTDQNPIVTVLKALNENQLALGAAIEEIALWLDARGSTEVVDNIRGALDALDRNLNTINRGISEIA
ncbi:hypothetical protein [Pseudomonas gingeri]|uniref:Uncharacterized protein n=1 Tax=Pseudomonas gingeri TaxID=117681 RepID=A0A7Y7WHF8_9PSED|nr:hypothetical protein [Pseudomonas gingeri]NWB49537.1 hypothetical protein [Pseudomonas gingeri]